LLDCCFLAGAYRATPHDSTGLTPYLMMLGREVKLPHAPDSYEQAGIKL